MKRRSAIKQALKGQPHRRGRPKPRKVPTAPVSAADLKKQVDTLTRALTEAREQQTATSDVLKVISRSTFDLQVVLDTLAESATRLCEAERTAVFLRDGNVFLMAARYGFSAEIEEYVKQHPLPLSRETLTGRVALTGGVVHIPDALADPEYTYLEGQRLGGFRAMLGVPLLREGICVGVMGMNRTTPTPYTTRQIELATTFAHQAVIAIENTRLLSELRQRTDDLSESLEQQTATSEVLKVISSSPSDLKPVFDAILKNATRICDAKFANLLIYDGSGFQVPAMYGAPREWAQLRQKVPVIQPGPKNPLGRVIKTKQLQHIADITKEAAYIEREPAFVQLAELAGARTLLIVPMIKESELVGTVGIYRQEVRPFTDKQIELVQNFAAQAVIAIENARLLNELRRRTDDLSESLEQQRATAEILGVISSLPADVQPVFDTIVRSFALLCGSVFGAIYTFDGELVHFAGSYGFTPEQFAAVKAKYPVRVDDPSVLSARAILARAPVHIDDVIFDAQYDRQHVAASGIRR